MEHRAKKRFGQNFLSDEAIINNIVRCIAPHHDDRLIEIGPGLGALSLPLLEHLDHLDVIELDRDIIPRLKSSAERRGLGSKLYVHEADVLAFDFSAYSAQHENGSNIRVVGNLPYNISTPILFHLLKFTGLTRDLHFMLQKEVVDRICSEPNSKSYGRLSVMLQTFYQAEHLFDVPPHAFRPAPKVTSAIIRLTPRPMEDVAHIRYEEFEKLVRMAFAQRRKTLRNTLKTLCTPEQISAAGFDPGARAENLSVNDFIHLSQNIDQQ